MRTETIFFHGLAGQIECAIDWPEEAPHGWALCLHPHPLFDGTHTNKVVTTLARTCVQNGFVALRPNFRGVGLSEGHFDHAKGETADMLALVEQFLTLYPQFQETNWVLGGFSFGTAVAAQLYAELADRQAHLPMQLLCLGSGIWRFTYRDITLPENTLLVHGEKDDVIPLTDVFTWLKDRHLPITVIPDAGHFFHGKLVMLKSIIQQTLSRALR